MTAIDDNVDQEEVVENVTYCSECDDYSEHEILKERSIGSGRDLLLKCLTCATISNLQIREPRSINVAFILTDGPHSKRTEIEVDDDELFNIGDVFEDDDMLWSINQIIDNEGRKQSSIHPSEVSVISALRTDMVRVKVTATRGEFSDSSSMLVDYGTKFTADTKIDYEGEVWRIRAIHTGSGRTLRVLLKHKISREYTYMSHQTLSTLSQKHHERDDKLGKRADLDTIQIRKYRKK